MLAVGSQQEDPLGFEQEATSVEQRSHHRAHAAFLHVENSFLHGDGWIAYLSSWSEKPFGPQRNEKLHKMLLSLLMVTLVFRERWRRDLGNMRPVSLDSSSGRVIDTGYANQQQKKEIT